MLARVSFEGRTCGITEEHSRRLLKKAKLLTRQPRRAKTRLVPNKAAASPLTLVSRFTAHVSRLLGEMGSEPIADRCGHLVKILPPSKLVIGAW